MPIPVTEYLDKVRTVVGASHVKVLLKVLILKKLVTVSEQV
jgi:hypothetical protein